MIRHVGAEPPWEGKARISGRVLWWVEMDPLWTGERVWHLVDRPQPTVFERLLRALPSRVGEKVRWLEDEFLPGVGA